MPEDTSRYIHGFPRQKWKNFSDARKQAIENGKPSITGRLRKGTWTWVVFGYRGTYNFGRWADAYQFATENCVHLMSDLEPFK